MMNPHRIILAAALVTISFAWGQAVSPIQSWTDSSGRVLKAWFVKLADDAVVVKAGDGQTFAISFSKLSAASVEQAKRLGSASPPELPTVPAPAAATNPVLAATGSVSIAPGVFLGKIFEQCEATLGKAEKVEAPDGKSRAFARSYKSPVPGVSRIKLQRVPEGSMQGPVPERVNYIWYYFPKGTINNLGEAFDKIGLTKEGVKIGVSYSTYGLTEEEVANVRRNASEMQKTASMSAALDRVLGRSVSEISGDLRAHWTTAESSMTKPPEYQHPDEDALSVSFNPNRRVAPAPKLVLQTSPELEKNGAFGFPQASARVLGNQTVKELRLSAWSNADWLYVQAVIWADGDDTPAIVPDGDGKMRKEGSTLHLDLDADKEPTAELDRRYRLYEDGLSYQVVAGRDSTHGLKYDSKGRGSVQYVHAADGKKIRVDSFLIPLAEIGRRPGDKIRLAFYGQSATPGFDFNSAGVRFSAGNGERGPMLASPDVARMGSHEFTVGEQTGAIDPAQLPDPRMK